MTDYKNNPTVQSFQIFNADGTSFHELWMRKATHESSVMSLGDKLTGDVYYKDNSLAVTMREYVEYNGVRYVLVNPPTVVREGMASDNGQLKGMTKYSFEFYHPMCMLGNFPFTDVAVKSDEEQYLSQNKTFSWIGNCFDFIAKLNKNLESTQWVVVTSDDEESLSKMGVLSDVLTFDKPFISDALKTAYDTWSVPFVIENLSAGEYFDSDNVDYYTKGKRFVIVFGLPSNEILDRESTSGTVVTVTTHATADIYYYTKAVTVPANQKIFLESLTDGATPIILNSTRNGVIGTTNRVFPVQTTIYIAATKDNAVIRYSYDESKVFVFKFGQGVGLKNNSRTPRNNKIVTRLAGYGSERNIPYGYPQIVWTGSSTATCTVGSSVGVKENVTINGHHYDRVMSYPLYDGIVGGQRVKLIKHPFTRNHLMPSVYSETVNKKVNPYAQGFDPDIEIVDYYDAPSSYPNPIVPSAPSFEIHEFPDTYPELGEAAIVSAVPYNQEPSEKTVYSSVSDFLYMLQNSIKNAANANEAAAMQRLYNALSNGATTYSDSNTGGAYTYSVTVTSKDNGVMYVKYTSGSFNIDTTVRYRAETPQWIDDMDDDGNYLQSYFKITLPKLSFDIYACASITEKMDINMRSGACIGCTFPVYVDWEDYKKSFYTSDGVFAPDGAQRDLTKYPKSNQGQITVLVKKEIETFGTLMPNIYQTPKAGDKFVVLGISLPLSYITSAEERLDEAMMEYMLENNVYYYDYPLKFDEYFLATHLEILSQIRNNTIVRFKYGNEPTMALYVKQMVVKYGEKALPQYDITLTDDVEVVLNQIGQVTDDVSRMRVQMSELQKYYSQDIADLINEKLSRVADDVAQGRITFQQGLDSVGNMILSDEVRSREFTTGLYTGRGWRIDALGNAEMESLRVRSYLEVIELLINRLQAQEGDTVFTDNDQVEKVDTIVSSTDGSVSYVLSLKEKYDGYVTGQMYGNIVKGIINTLAAKQAGVSDVDDTPDTEHDGENSYFTSWMRVVGTHATDSSLGINQIRVELYSDDYTDPTTGEVHREIPSGKNFAPCELMTIARWGCYLDPDEEGISSAEKLSRERRQRMFMISVTDGRVVKHTKVNKPILSDWNYGVTIGELPEFVKNYPNVKSVLDVVGEHTDWLYAQGVVVEKFIKVDVNGKPEVEIVDCGDWVDGSTGTPSVRAGIYYHDEWNSIAQQYETHDVWHNGALWRCLVSQPVVSGGVTRFYEPTERNSTYWKKLIPSGDTWALNFFYPASEGEAEEDELPLTLVSVRTGHVDFSAKPKLLLGNEDVTEENVTAWKWTRESFDTAADATWNTQGKASQRTLHITNGDVPSGWKRGLKLSFICTATLAFDIDGSGTIVNRVKF